jgi:WD40 repeat protein
MFGLQQKCTLAAVFGITDKFLATDGRGNERLPKRRIVVTANVPKWLTVVVWGMGLCNPPEHHGNAAIFRAVQASTVQEQFFLPFGRPDKESSELAPVVLSVLPRNRGAFASWSPDGRRIVSVTEHEEIVIWDAENGTQVQVRPAHRDRIRFARYSPDGRRIVSTSADKTAVIWDEELKVRLMVFREHRDVVSWADFDPCGFCLVTASYDKKAILWDVRTGAVVRTLVHSDWVRCAAFSPDGTRILTASENGEAIIWDAETGRAIVTLEEHEGPVFSAQWSPDGLRVATGTVSKRGSVGFAHVWDVSTGRLLRTFSEEGGPMRAVAFSPDGSRLLTACGNKVSVWNLPTGMRVFGLREHKGTVWSAEFSPDALRIVTTSADGSTRVWSAKDGRELVQFWSLRDGNWVTVTPQGYYNASEGAVGRVRHLDKTGKLISARLSREYYQPWRVKEMLANP